jgi:hypothetical protein
MTEFSAQLDGDDGQLSRARSTSSSTSSSSSSSSSCLGRCRVRRVRSFAQLFFHSSLLSSVLLVLLVTSSLPTSVVAEYTWNGSEWVWSEDSSVGAPEDDRDSEERSRQIDLDDVEKDLSKKKEEGKSVRKEIKVKERRKLLRTV